jgi:NADH:ubiquinone oxidoreductase subunit 6 (subunit J)
MFLLTLSAIFILCVKNPLYAVFGLILVFLNSAFVLLSLEVNYLALVYVVLYVGAICVLFLFVVMLLNLRVYDVNNRKTHRNELILFFLSCLVCMVSYLSITKPDINTQLIITTISNVLTELHATDIVTSYLFQNIMVVLLLTLLLLLAIVSPLLLHQKVQS